ncbi:hypothetical protein ACIQWR_22795 [Streptomyces sp. NPDC098789]|uniref:hypothetical protein n=1 Tax=Streptomyces sp. NPDC098789 TaxID=3366098 RepID=UPI00380B2AB0
MNHRIARVFEPFLRLFLPTRRWPRAAASPITAYVPAAPKATARPGIHTLLAAPGEVSPLAGAHLGAYHFHLREEERLRRQRRRNLWFATYGIDLDTRNIHRMGVA